jgi:hypothetical protein
MKMNLEREANRFSYSSSARSFKGASQSSQRNDAHIVKNATALK